VASSIFLYRYIVYSIFLVIIFVDLLRYLTIGIKELSLARSVGTSFFFFRFFFREEKEGRDILDDFCRFM
jgi:hypothetical protein